MECLEQSEIDLSFVIDSSSSIGDANFAVMKDFVIKIIKSFSVGPANTQVRQIVSVRYYMYLNNKCTKSSGPLEGVE